MRYAILFSFLSCLVSCIQDNLELTNEPVPVQVQFASIYFEFIPSLKMVENNWSENDAIGIYMMNAGTGVISNEADNRKYTTSGTGTNVTFTSSTPIYYPLENRVDFATYYPYSSTATGKYTIALSNQTQVAEYDNFMYARVENKYTSNPGIINFNFKHFVSKIIFDVRKGDNLESAYMNDLVIDAEGMPSLTEFDLRLGQFTTKESKTIRAATKISGSKYELTIAPQSPMQNRNLKFIVGVDTFKYVIPENEQFQPGIIYTYTVTLDKTKLNVTKKTNIWINGWEQGYAGELGSEEKYEKNIDKELEELFGLVRIPKGSFIMGDDLNGIKDASPAHKVNISQDFYICKYPVTNAEWRKLMNDPLAPDNDEPRTDILWNQAVDYCNKFNELYGETYGIFCRLPTEAEWEYSCRASTTTMYFFGNQRADYYVIRNNLFKYCYSLNLSGNRKKLVGKLLPNPWGLYDINGNIHEMCSDFFAQYSAVEQTDPKGPLTGNTKVTRGGCFNDAEGSDFLTSAGRRFINLDNMAKFSTTGFRIACTIVKK